MDLTNLHDNGDILDLGDGHFLRVKIGYDPYTDINDFDFYGQVGWGDKNIWGRDQRPKGFDGNAEKIPVMHGMIWWQPPADIKRGTTVYKDLRDLVSDLASFGFKTVTLEYGHGADAYGNLIVRDYATVGGVDDTSPECLADILNDLVSELTIDPQSPMNTYEGV